MSSLARRAVISWKSEAVYIKLQIVYLKDDEYYCGLTKRMMFLVDDEECVKEMQEPVFAERLAKLLMMSSNRRLNVMTHEDQRVEEIFWISR
ncbi:hypothetical protein RHMOL_Rhmol13G0260300 [Rhododendron molle]|uniref:Uncharacterized protein n=1 Tax=Rhododendron molle TaxID=49168 RepID=A0ACC0LBW1_RHOML|nr:hypothetical protein RHMOL_Rhmol13G0260300 [Rhododendron molle]